MEEKSDLNPLDLLVYLISSIFHVLDKYQRILKGRITLNWTKPCITYVYLDIWVYVRHMHHLGPVATSG